MAEAKTKTKASKKTTKKKNSDNPVYLKIKRENEKFQGAIGEIMEECREFTVPGADDDRTLRVYFPPPSVESSVNQTYSKIYGRLLQDDDHLPEAQILEMMKKRGVWSDEKDLRIERLQERVSRLRNVIFLHGLEGMTSSEMDKNAEDYENTEKEMQDLVSVRSGFTSNSIETRAYETKIKDQVWQCVKQVVDGNECLLWNNLEDIDKESNRVLLYRVINECISFWQGVPSNFLEDSQESLDGESDIQLLKQQDSNSSESQSQNGVQSD